MTLLVQIPDLGQCQINFQPVIEKKMCNFLISAPDNSTASQFWNNIVQIPDLRPCQFQCQAASGPCFGILFVSNQEQ